MYREKWQEAFNEASFYKSEKNTSKYWNEVAKSGDSGLGGTDHIEILIDYLFKNQLIEPADSILDVGCGTGDYALLFAKKCRRITTLDYAKSMIDVCKKRIDEAGLTNVSYIADDIESFNSDEKYDCVLACLNPITYQPKILDKLMDTAKKCVVYFSMDTSLENADKEPIYRGCNSVKYAEEYLKESGIKFDKIPYIYNYPLPDGGSKEIHFAYIIIRVQ
ncbi:MAG: methyltransferase domain-containing protein [Lachnospiraceae bacterium]|nr:methyltransferase domain-containing protein [Lachnospiraceae bacterium]